MTWDNDRKVSDWENARSRTSHTPAPRRKRQYLVCTAPKCKGWEWARNQRVTCRERGCGAALANHSSSPTTPKAPGSGKSALAAALGADLDQLELKFPGIRAHVQTETAPVPQAPAAGLHSAQTACQVSLRNLQQVRKSCGDPRGAVLHKDFRSQ